MRPIEFGGCFGWLHPGAGSRGVVLCSPVGYEQLCIHRVWRGLADEIATAGMPTLRFDWHGTGESAGSDMDPARMLAWLESLRGAIQRLRQETGVSEIVLVGLRLGATLAALIAEEMDDIEGLALLAPVVSGKSYLREMRALSAFGSQKTETTDNSLEAAGFVLTERTLAEMRGIDLVAGLRRRPAGRVLLMHRPDMPADGKLAERLVQLGATVEQGDIPGYGDFVCDSQWSRAPRQAFDRLLAWLKQGARARALQLGMPMPTQIRVPGAVEEPVALKGRAALMATSCTPVSRDFSRPAILFLNTGWYARMGANRMAVTLARRYAQQGIASLRVDLAGVGDSDAAPEADSEVYNLKSCADLKAGLDWLEARGHRQVVLFGMCSAAISASR
jgi:alpha-beta hydrolase superfamily lysophospholipase